MNDIYLLDACALVAFMKKELGWDKVHSVFTDGAKEKAKVFIHEINLLEVYYGFRKERGREYAEQTLNKTLEYFTVINGLTPEVFTEAGRFKSTYRISLADAIALAQATALNAKLLTCDHHEFDVVEPLEDVEFLWIR